MVKHSRINNKGKKNNSRRNIMVKNPKRHKNTRGTFRRKPFNLRKSTLKKRQTGGATEVDYNNLLTTLNIQQWSQTRPKLPLLNGSQWSATNNPFNSMDVEEFRQIQTQLDKILYPARQQPREVNTIPSFVGIKRINIRNIEQFINDNLLAITATQARANQRANQGAQAPAIGPAIGIANANAAQSRRWWQRGPLAPANLPPANQPPVQAVLANLPPANQPPVQAVLANLPQANQLVPVQAIDPANANAAQDPILRGQPVPAQLAHVQPVPANAAQPRPRVRPQALQLAPQAPQLAPQALQLAPQAPQLAPVQAVQANPPPEIITINISAPSGTIRGLTGNAPQNQEGLATVDVALADLIQTFP